jgi:hypothetical protein
MQDWSISIKGLKGISRHVKEERAIKQKQIRTLLFVALNGLPFSLNERRRKHEADTRRSCKDFQRLEGN